MPPSGKGGDVIAKPAIPRVAFSRAGRLESGDESSAKARFGFYVLLAAVWGLAAFVVVAPFGLDHRSAWGLDIDQLIRSLGFLAVLILVTAGYAGSTKNWHGVWLALLPVALVLIKLLLS